MSQTSRYWQCLIELNRSRMENNQYRNLSLSWADAKWQVHIRVNKHIHVIMKWQNVSCDSSYLPLPVSTSRLQDETRLILCYVIKLHGLFFWRRPASFIRAFEENALAKTQSQYTLIKSRETIWRQMPSFGFTLGVTKAPSLPTRYSPTGSYRHENIGSYDTWAVHTRGRNSKCCCRSSYLSTLSLWNLARAIILVLHTCLLW